MTYQNRITSWIFLGLFSAHLFTYEHKAHALQLPKPTVSMQTFMTMAALYTLGAFFKNPVKELAHQNVQYWFNEENLNEALAVKSVAKTIERGVWGSAAFTIYNVLQYHGMAPKNALASTIAFNAGLTFPFIKDVIKNMIKWFHENLENQSTEQDPLLFLTSALVQCIKDFLIMNVGYYAGLESYKLGKFLSTKAVTTVMPRYTEHAIYTADQTMKLAFIIQKMIGKYIESYCPGAFYHKMVKPALTNHTDPSIEDPEDTIYFVGLLHEIFTYVTAKEHTGLLHAVIG